MKNKYLEQYEHEFMTSADMISDIQFQLDEYEIEEFEMTEEQIWDLENSARILNMLALNAKKKWLEKRNTELFRRLNSTLMHLSSGPENECKLQLAIRSWEERDLYYVKKEIRGLLRYSAELQKLANVVKTQVAKEKIQTTLDELARTETSLRQKARDLRVSIRASQHLDKKPTLSNELQSIRQEQDISISNAGEPNQEIER